MQPKSPDRDRNFNCNTKSEYIPKIQIGKWPCPALLLPNTVATS
jgi:hypothetical protein